MLDPLQLIKKYGINISYDHSAKDQYRWRAWIGSGGAAAPHDSIDSAVNYCVGLDHRKLEAELERIKEDFAPTPKLFPVVDLNGVVTGYTATPQPAPEADTDSRGRVVGSVRVGKKPKAATNLSHGKDMTKTATVSKQMAASKKAK